MEEARIRQQNATDAFMKATAETVKHSRMNNVFELEAAEDDMSENGSMVNGDIRKSWLMISNVV